MKPGFDIETFNHQLRIALRVARKLAFELGAALAGKRFYCSALSGDSNYNICVNSDMTVSCNCRDMDGTGRIGDLARGNLDDVFKSSTANRFRLRLASGRLAILTCASCPELKMADKRVALHYVEHYHVPRQGIMVENTVACCYQCKGCSRREVSRIRRKPAMSVEDMRHVSSQIRDYRIERICFFNLGDPFSTDRVFE